MAGASTAIGFAMHWMILHEFEKIRIVGAENLTVINEIHDFRSTLTWAGTLGVVLLSVLCFGLWIVSSHKVFGPTVPLRRHIRNLAAGDYSSRVRLRSDDELKELGADLNALAEALEQKNQQRRKAA